MVKLGILYGGYGIEGHRRDARATLRVGIIHVEALAMGVTGGTPRRRRLFVQSNRGGRNPDRVVDLFWGERLLR